MKTVPVSVWIGFDPRESAAFAVARQSIRDKTSLVPIYGLVLDDLRAQGLYTRPTEKRLGKLWDEISGAHMATEFAVSRFLVHHLATKVKTRAHGDCRGWAIFMDCDVLVRANLWELFDQLDDSFAVMCVKHRHEPTSDVKMDGQVQTRYPRKNWTSVMAINADHPANERLSLELVNSLPGRDLHALCWLEDRQIGEFGPEWNWLVGHSPGDVDPKIVHFTDGLPYLTGFENVPFAAEWRAALNKWAA